MIEVERCKEDTSKSKEDCQESRGNGALVKEENANKIEMPTFNSETTGHGSFGYFLLFLSEMSVSFYCLSHHDNFILFLPSLYWAYKCCTFRYSSICLVSLECQIFYLLCT